MRLLSFLLFTCVTLPAVAAGKDMEAIRHDAGTWLTGEVRQAYANSTPSIQIDKPDERLRLPECVQVRFFLPSGSRLFGGGALGVQCLAPRKWNLYFTYRVALSGPALTALRPLPAGQALTSADVSLSEVKYEQDPGAYLTRIPANTLTRRPIMVGQPLFVFDLRLPDVIQAGARVRLHIKGNGFSVSSEGKALNAAKVGEPVQVKMGNGRIVTGHANENGEVEISQ